MRITITSLIRLTVVTALAASCAAVGVSRLAPPVRSWRMPCQVNFAGFNEFFLADGAQGVRWIPRDGQGKMRLPIPSDECLDYASCSPWRDEQGRSQVAGRWSLGIRSGGGEMGIARFSIPDGEVLDHVVTKAIPIGSPCWYPGTTARILFAAGDGRLYDHAFEPAWATPDEPNTSSLESIEAEPRPIPIRCPSLEDREVFVSDPHWSSDSRFTRIILVSLRSMAKNIPRPVFNAGSIWWLRLSEDGGTIEEGGRLLDASKESGNDEVEERAPVLGRTPDGKLSLAYLRKAGNEPWELWNVGITFDGKSKQPVASPGPGAKLMDDCQPCPPSFTTDGRHIVAVTSGSRTRGEIREIDLDALDNRKSGSKAD